MKKQYFILFFVFLILATAGLAYCNETITYSSGINSSNYNITKTCSADEFRSDSTAGITVLLFIMFINVIVFYFAFKKDKYSSNLVTDFIIKRSLLVIGTYLLTFNSVIVATIADSANLNLNNEIFRYMWLLGMAGYLAMLWLAFGTIIKIPELWKKQKERIFDNEDY